jgi:serine/threonine protein kinase
MAGDPPTPRPPSSAEEAFAATVAPTSSAAAVPTPTSSSAPTPPKKLPAGTSKGDEATIAAAVLGAMPPLPEVADGLYKTDKEIARGGMGRIVAAEDRRLGRPVALKELLDPTGEQVTRFQREALITARLQHPGIVPVYEAGVWPTGEPFFAMKLVSGRPLDKVIADTTSLSERLALLPRIAAACDAMAYAHSQRIIHRDLKPGNILLGDFGETVVIDWGLAKDLDAADTLESANRQPRVPSRKSESVIETGSSTLTVAGAVMGTPAYMAPEQARGEPVDQRADVFALGAMIYHVLAGAPPYNARTATDVIAAAALSRVIPLHEREKRTPRDLRAIVERAMAASPDDRYPTAGELAEELRRFLTGQLVDAHRYTALQRLGRFVKRHRAAVTISAIATTGFVVGGSIAINRIVEARDIAQREELVATARETAAERLIDYMFSHVQDQLTAIGRLDLMANLGTEVKHYYDTLSKIPGGMSGDDHRRMAEAIDLIGRAERVSGKPDQALASWRQARDKLDALIARDQSPRTFKLRAMIAKLDFESGSIYAERGKTDEAAKYFDRAKDAYDKLQAEQPTSRDLMLGAADNHDQLGDLLRREGKIDEAFDEYTVARTLRDRASSQGNGNVTPEVLARATSHLKLGSIYQNRGELQLALDEYKQSLKLRQTVLDGQPDNVEVQKAVLDVEEQLAWAESSFGDDTAAIDTFRRALPVTQQLQRRDPTNADWAYQRGNLLADLGFALIDSGEFKDGVAQIEASIDAYKELAARDPKSTRYQIALSRSYTRDGDAHLYVGQTDEGINQYKAALDIRKQLVERDAQSVAFRRSYAWAFAKLGNAYVLKGDLGRAQDAHEQALALRKQLVVESPAGGEFKNELASTEIELGKLLLPSDARHGAELLEAGLARARGLVTADPLNLEWKETVTRGLIASARLATSDAKQRRTALDEALATAEEAVHRTPQNVHWPGYLAEVHVGLAELATAANDARLASGEWKKARDILEPLAKAGRLPAARMPLLERARAQR